MERRLSTGDILLIAGTRVALGIGIGLLLSGKIGKHQRRNIGLVLSIAGGLSTIPIILHVNRKQNEELRAAA